MQHSALKTRLLCMLLVGIGACGRTSPPPTYELAFVSDRDGNGLDIFPTTIDAASFRNSLPGRPMVRPSRFIVVAGRAAGSG